MKILHKNNAPSSAKTKVDVNVIYVILEYLLKNVVPFVNVRDICTVILSYFASKVLFMA